MSSTMPVELNTPEMTARIIEWQADKGYGWLQCGKRRVFLHRRDCSKSHRLPTVGDEVRFTLGQDAQGRPCAVKAVPVNARATSDFNPMSLVLLSVLLVLPGYALLQQRGLEIWNVATYGLVLSLITYSAYASDKRKAQASVWRTPESYLHLLEMLGGWPGAWVAQRRLRHKCSKRSYQCMFWAIICIYQFAAYDSLQNWKYSQWLIQQIEREIAQGRGTPRQRSFRN